jgi:uncharacterized protein YdbL (DUF1318 family)
MTYRSKLIAAAAVGLAIAAGATVVARAQGSASPVAAAIDAGTVGEQADGYLGVRGTVTAAIRSAVEAINIKRRAGYTQLAEQRGVTVKDVAAAVGCKTLANRVGSGEAYQLRDGVWRVRNGDAPIDLPDYCAS